MSDSFSVEYTKHPSMIGCSRVDACKDVKFRVRINIGVGKDASMSDAGPANSYVLTSARSPPSPLRAAWSTHDANFQEGSILTR